MFNHFSVRPIGSVQFEEHLLGLMIKAAILDEDARLAIPEYPLILEASQNGHSTYDPIEEGWKALANAVLAQTIIDYLDEYEKRLRLEEEGRDAAAYVHECRCLTLENEYFRDEYGESDLLDSILREIIHNPDDHGKLHHRIYRIERAKRRLSVFAH